MHGARKRADEYGRSRDYLAHGKLISARSSGGLLDPICQRAQANSDRMRVTGVLPASLLDSEIDRVGDLAAGQRRARDHDRPNCLLDLVDLVDLVDQLVYLSGQGGHRSKSREETCCALLSRFQDFRRAGAPTAAHAPSPKAVPHLP